MRRALLIAMTLVLLPACTDDGPPDVTAPEREPIVYVAVGASETVGHGLAEPEEQAWPRLFLRTLPDDTRFTSVGVSGAKVATALQQQAGPAVDAQPTLVTVWLNVNDIAGFVAVETYEQQLRDLVRRLRRNGEATVLVANTPALDKLPALARFRLPASLVNTTVDRYNVVIKRVVDAERAVLVDLHSASLRARAEGKEASYVGPDGFHPSAAGHEAAAAEFAAAYRATAAVASR
ncbi:MAG TPA: SGNH/GDSL hydrolase family protein [Acidimicrobiales bacterium]|nr:SGNH/GDSL hydrolase family protein [Acidimicrobiales bacterium]